MVARPRHNTVFPPQHFDVPIVSHGVALGLGQNENDFAIDDLSLYAFAGPDVAPPAVTFAYDALGRRVKTVVEGSPTPETTYFVYDGADVNQERDGTGAITAEYLYGDGVDNVIRMDRDTDGDSTPEQYYFHHDAVNSTIALTGADGNIAEHYVYSDYGTPAILTPGLTPLRR